MMDTMLNLFNSKKAKNAKSKDGKSSASNFAASNSATNTSAANVDAANRINNSTADLEKLMSEFRVGDKKSNLVQLDIAKYFPNDSVTKIASLLEQSSNLSNKTYRMYFDPVQEIVLKKMIGEDVLNKRVVIDEHDFFKGIILLNYYCTVISKSYDIIDSLHKFAVQLERVDKHKDPLLKDVIDYVLQNSFKKNIFINDHVEKGTSEAYTSMKQEINLSGTQYIKMSPIYTGAAQIIKDSVNNYGQNLIAIESRADLSALIFTDALYPYIQHDSNVQLVNTNLKNKDFLNASIYALQIASKGYYIDHIDKKLRGNL